MVDFLIRWVINTIALIAVINIVPGIHADNWQAAALAALILGLLNAFLKPLILLMTLPFSVFSLGFFTLLVNGFLFFLVPKLTKGFYIADFWNAFWGAIFFSIISFLLNVFLNPQQKLNMRFYHSRSSASQKDDHNVIDVEGKTTDEDHHNKKSIS